MRSKQEWRRSFAASLFYVPTPNKLNTCGPGALSVIVTIADRPPLAEGVKITLIVQLAPAARLVPQVPLLAKSPALAPSRLIPLMLIGAARPLLVSVIVRVALTWPTIWLPKPTLPALRLRIGVRTIALAILSRSIVVSIMRWDSLYW